MDTNKLSGAELAYFGDAVVELLSREYMIKSGVVGVGALNKQAMHYVTAKAQSEALERILPHLTEQETAAFKRGRNNHVSAVPKSASACEYRRATGFEALFAMLWLSGQEARARELFEKAYPAREDETKT